MMKPCGTILPTRKSLQRGDAHADLMAARRERIAATKLSKFTRRVVGGETRYYDGGKRFAVVGRDESIKWFEIREDGYEYATKPH